MCPSLGQVSSTEFWIEPCLPSLDRNSFSLPHFFSTKWSLSVSFLIQLYHMYQCTFEACVARFYSSYYRLMTPIVWKSSFLSVENRLSLWIQSVCFLSRKDFWTIYSCSEIFWHILSRPLDNKEEKLKQEKWVWWKMAARSNWQKTRWDSFLHYNVVVKIKILTKKVLKGVVALLGYQD